MRLQRRSSSAPTVPQISTSAPPHSASLGPAVLQEVLAPSITPEISRAVPSVLLVRVQSTTARSPPRPPGPASSWGVRLPLRPRQAPLEQRPPLHKRRPPALQQRQPRHPSIRTPTSHILTSRPHTPMRQTALLRTAPASRIMHFVLRTWRVSARSR